MEICQTCLTSGDCVNPMTTDDLKCYRLIMTKIEDPLDVMYICIYCRSLLQRLVRFVEQCRSADVWFKDASYKINEAPIINNRLSSSSTIYHYLGPQLDINGTDIKTESTDEDDNPLSLLNDSNFLTYDEAMINQMPVIKSKLSISTTIRHYLGPELETNGSDVKTEITDEDNVPLSLLNDNDFDCFDYNERSESPKEEVDIKSESLDNSQCNGKQKSKNLVKEGFSSRMVTETNEYVVIKLTKEQILEEMKQNSETEKYKIMPYKCEKCVRGFNFEEVLQTHMEKHSEKNGPFKCELCEQYCPSKVSLRGHMKSHSSRYKCKLCNIVRLSRQHILEHYSLEHAAAPAVYSCPTCNYTTNKRTVIQRHVRKHSSNESLKCHICGKLYKTKVSLRIHISRHDGRKLHHCHACNSSFIYASQLKKHMQCFHVRKDYYCVECDIMFKSSENLKRHLERAKRHRDSSSYKHQCPQCEERFVSPSTLATHQTQAHGTIKTEICSICSRNYSSREALRWHIRRHHDKQQPPKIPCTMCDRTFSRKYVLRVHMRTHTGDRPYSCFCGATFTQLSALRAHTAAKHKVQLPAGGEQRVQMERNTLTMGNEPPTIFPQA